MGKCQSRSNGLGYNTLGNEPVLKVFLVILAIVQQADAGNSFFKESLDWCIVALFVAFHAQRATGDQNEDKLLVLGNIIIFDGSGQGQLLVSWSENEVFVYYVLFTLIMRTLLFHYKSAMRVEKTEHKLLIDVTC